MKKLPLVVLSLLVASCLAITIEAQTKNSNAGSTSSKTTSKKRGPIFRATKDQIKQAQAILKLRGFYAGGQTGKLDSETRAGLKKYQQAESIKVTGTLNKLTLEKMGIALTESQKST